MTHFTALNRHGKLSVLGRVSLAAAPACHASTKRELFFFPPGFNRHIAQEFASKHIQTLSYWLHHHKLRMHSTSLHKGIQFKEALIIWKK